MSADEREKEVKNWIEEFKPSFALSSYTLAQNLKDGVILCELVNKFEPGKIPKINNSSYSFKHMENIQYFLKAVKTYGLRDDELFKSFDLYHSKDMGQVINCILAFKRIVKGGMPIDNQNEPVPPLERSASMISPPIHKTKHEELIKRAFSTAILEECDEQERRSTVMNHQQNPAIEPPVLITNISTDLSNSKADTSKLEMIPQLTIESPKSIASLAIATEDRELVAWMELVLGRSLDVPPKTLHLCLKDGRVLCEIANVIKPGSVKKIHESAMAYKQIENIGFFLGVCRSFGVSDHELFKASDLYEDKDMRVVVRCLYALGQCIQTNVPEYAGPTLGPKIDKKDPRRLSSIGSGSSTRPHPSPYRESSVNGGMSALERLRTSIAPGTPETSALCYSHNKPINTPVNANVVARNARVPTVVHPADEKELVQWIESVLGKSLESESLGDALKTGVVLCEVLNAIKPGTIRKINDSVMPFKQMENITNFLRAIRPLGVAETDVFTTVDLYEQRDINAVVRCMFSLGRAIQTSVPEFSGPMLGQEVKTSRSSK